VATSIESFRSYQMTEAWTWEHLALTRARVLAGEPTLAHEVETFRREVLAVKGQGASVRADVAEMRTRLAAAKPGAGLWDAKFGAGRLMDIELLAQTFALIAASPARNVERQIASGAKVCNLSQSDQTVLVDGYRLCWRLQASLRLLSDASVDPAALGIGGRAFVLRETAAASVDELSARLARAADLAETVINAHLVG
jgi:glutamate-ammonia-ligase adenylyltransferase